MKMPVGASHSEKITTEYKKIFQRITAVQIQTHLPPERGELSIRRDDQGEKGRLHVNQVF